ncbi:MAG: zinc finger domain-containing protein, partial [Mycobacteriales bacterium]
VGRHVTHAWPTAISVIKTFEHPPGSLVGGRLLGVVRHGKFLEIEVQSGPAPPVRVVIHLARGGWLQYREQVSTLPPKPGKGPLAFRVRLDDGAGFDLTEAGTKKNLAVYLVDEPSQVPGIARLGPDALHISREEFGRRLGGENSRVKRVITDQKVLAGVGNAYSDEILHAAKLSPFAIASRLDEAQLDGLYRAMRAILCDATSRSVGGRTPELKSEKRSGLRVHARTGLPCPVCQDTIAEVAFSDRSLQYCPTCQTNGKPLADRRMSRLLR